MTALIVVLPLIVVVEISLQLHQSLWGGQRWPCLIGLCSVELIQQQGWVFHPRHYAAFSFFAEPPLHTLDSFAILLWEDCCCLFVNNGMIQILAENLWQFLLSFWTGLSWSRRVYAGCWCCFQQGYWSLWCRSIV
jgi:hypothetical protein